MSAPSKVRRIGVPLAALAALLAVWELVVDVGLVPNFLLPTPVQVVAALVEDAQLIAGHCVVTLGEAADR